MKKKLFISSVFIVLAVISINSLFAQPRRRRYIKRKPKIEQSSSIGVRLGKDFENDQFLLGGQFSLPLGIFWSFVPSAEYYFTNNDSSQWQFNGDFHFKPKPNGIFYFGGGVAMQYINSEDINEQMDFGGNVLVGLDFGRIRGPILYPYVEARWTFIEKEHYFYLLGGINLILR